MQKVISELQKLANPEKIKILSSFFKTWKWQYGEWDKFLWIPVPQQRTIAKQYFQETSLKDFQELIQNEYHEIRLTALLILCEKYKLCTKKKDSKWQKEIVDLYLKNTKYINNRDLVDLSCYNILGHYLLDKDRNILYELVKSTNMREQRISIISTLIFIRKWDCIDWLKLSEILLPHKHDLIHKAVWRTLREIWKKDKNLLIDFLDTHYKEMSRTTLRYAIEKLDEETKNYYMKK